MLVQGLFTATASLYGVACAIYLAHLLTGRQGLTRISNACLGTAALVHVGYLAADMTVNGNTPAAEIHGVLSLVSLGIVTAFLVVTSRRPVTVLGAFVTPVTLLFFLGSGLGRSVEHVPRDVRDALLPVHIGVNVIGVAAFALAFGASLAYVIQEYFLRRKQLGGAFQRLPALDVLDSLSYRASGIGFTLLTVGVATGAIWMVREQAGPLITPPQAMGIATWLVFAAVLGLRVLAGWQGRRAAVGTIVGFLCSASVLAIYVVRAAGGGAS